jgi:nicotinamide riboside transporter PnuC
VIKKVKLVTCIIISLVILGYTFYKWLANEHIGKNELFSITFILSTLFSTLTWSPTRQEGITEDEELGRYIILRSTKISYFVLVFSILIIFIIEELVFKIENMALLLVLCLSLIILPCTEYLIAKKYR